jgi:4-aminobutyrate aminotransferase
MPRSQLRKTQSRRSEGIIRRLQKSVAKSVQTPYYPIVVEEAHDCTVTDVDGRTYLDFIAGWTVAGVGYSNRDVGKAVKAEFDRNAGVAPGIFPSEVTVRFAEKLIQLTPGKFEKKVWFGHSGTDACAAPFKLIPRVTKKPRILSFYGSMFGVDVGGMSMAGHPATSKYPIPTLATKIPYAYCYRCPYGMEYPSCGIYCASSFVEENVLKYLSPPEDTSFMIVEPIQSDAGDIVPPPGYLEMLKRTCDKFGILFVVNEVKIGFGRTGKMFGVEHAKDVIPDGIALGKSIGSGIPVGAFVARKELVDTGFALSTLSGNAIGAAAGLATIDYIKRNKLPDNATKCGAHLLKLLREVESRHLLVGDVRGKGLIVGVELVKNRTTKEPAKLEAAKVVYRAWQLGLLTAFVGADSNVIEITPPLTISIENIERGVEIMEHAISDVEHGSVSDLEVKDYTGF